jgi:polysaccharide biosynthesis transport protein
MRNIQPPGSADPLDPTRLEGRRVPPVPPGDTQAVPIRLRGDDYGGSSHHRYNNGYGYGDGYQSPQQVDFAHLWHFLLAKAWVIALITAIALGLGYTYFKHAPAVYAVMATVQVEPDPPNFLGRQMGESRNIEAVDYLQTVAQSLKSRLLLEHVADTCKLWNDPLFTNRVSRAPLILSGTKLASLFSAITNEPVGRDSILDSLDQMVKVHLRRGTRLIDIMVTHRVPECAVSIANSIVQEYINENAEREDTSIGLATKSLSKEAEQLRKKLEQSENALQAYVEQHKTVSLDERQNIVGAKLRELSTGATEAKSLRLKTETEYAQITSLGTNNVPALMTVPTVAKDPTVQALQMNLARAENDFIGLCQRYKAKHPKYIQARTQIDGLTASLTNAVLSTVQTLKATLESARSAEEALNQAMQDQEASALELNKLSIQYRVLEREVASDRALYEEVRKGAQEASVAKATQQAGIMRMVERAHLPDKPVWPKKLAILAISGLGGILLSALVLMGLRVTDTSIKTVDEAESLLGLPVCSAVSQMKKARGADRELVVVSNPKSAGAEAFRTLRASLATLGDLENRQVFLFTSALPGEGKTFCSLNFAASLAQLGLKTLLIDADLRKPSIEMSLVGEDSGSPGVTDYLSGQKKLEEVVRPARVKNLYLLSGGSTAANPAELLAKDGLEGLVKEALRHYDRLVLDSAPINAVGDTLLILKSVQTVCLVIRAAHTSRHYVLRCVQLLQSAKAPLSAVVLNRMPRHRGPIYGAYYDYHYHGKYGKDGVYGAAKTG